MPFDKEYTVKCDRYIKYNVTEYVVRVWETGDVMWSTM